MKPQTKRIMEAIIVIAILMCVLHHVMDARNANLSNQEIKTYSKLINQAQWDAHGPGSMEAYVQLFEFDRNQLIQKAKNAVQSIKSHLYNDGFVLVPDAPHSIHQQFNDALPIIEKATKTLEFGPPIPAPDEIYFASPTGCYNIVSFVNANEMIQYVQHLALRDWLEGNRGKALEKVKLILQFADAFKFNLDLISHLYANSFRQIAFDTLETFLWNNPGVNDNIRIFELVDQLKPDEWTFEPHTAVYLKDFLYNQQYFYQRLLFDYCLAASLLAPQNKPAGSHEAYEILQKHGVVPNDDLSIAQQCSLLNKWTTLAAMRKRAANLPDTFYSDDDPILTPVISKQFPPLMYAAARYLRNENYVDRNFHNRFDKTRYRAQVMHAALWARCWRDRHGVWPTDEQFNQHSPSRFYMWHQTFDKQNQTVEMQKYDLHILVDHFMQFIFSKENIGTDRAQYFCNFLPDAEFNSAEIHFRLPYSLSLTYQSQKAHWLKGVFEAYKPLVKSVNINYGKNSPFWYERNEIYNDKAVFQYNLSIHPHDRKRNLQNMVNSYMLTPTNKDPFNYPDSLTIEITIPDKLVWIGYQEPSDEEDEFILPGDNPNSEKKDKDIFVLAGW